MHLSYVPEAHVQIITRRAARMADHFVPENRVL